jgi:tape measure domain-containing protein
MPTIRDLFVEIGLKVDDEPLKQFDRGIQRLESNLRTLRRGLLLVSAAGIAGFGFLIKKGGTLEQVEIGFETMLGSAEKAQETLAELFEFAKKTPFEIEGILGTSSQLLGMGFAAEDLIGILNDLGNIAAGLPNTSLERLALNLGQVRSQGKLTGRELRDFAVSGVPLLEELAKILDKTTAEVQALISQGKINFDLTRQAFANLAGEGGRFFNLMQRQSRTVFGIFSNILDVITLLAQDIGKDLSPIVKRLENQFLNFLETNKQIIKLRLRNLIKELIGGLKALWQIMRDIGKTLSVVVEALGGLENAIQLVAIALAFLFGISTLSAIGNIVIAIGTVTKALLFMGNTAAIATLKATALPLAIGVAVIALILLLEDVISFFTGKKSLTALVVKAFEEEYPNAFKKTVEGLEEIRDGLEFIKNIAKDIIEFKFKLAFEKTGALFESAFEGLKEKTVDVLRSMTEKLDATQRKLDTGQISSIADLFSDGITPAQAPATTTTNNLGANILTLTVPMTINALSGDDSSPEAIGEAVRSVFTEEFGTVLQNAHKATQPQVQR